MRVDGSRADGADGVFHKAGFVDRVGVNSDLHIVLVGGLEARVDGRGA
jgi:hypothetical protein